MKFYNDPEYILMCGEAWEVQNAQPDFLQSIEHNFYKNNDRGDTWLPRQDQLQEMTDFEYTLDYVQYKPNIEKNRTHSGYYVTENGSIRFITDSFEKTLMRIIYSKKYKKTWNGENWIEA